MTAARSAALFKAGPGSRHGSIGLGYPGRMSGVPNFAVRSTGLRSAESAAYEALPEDAIMQPELVVPTEDAALRKEAWRVLGMKAPSPSCWWHSLCNFLLGLQPMYLVGCSCLSYAVCLEGRLCPGGFSSSIASPEHIQPLASFVHLAVALACTGGSASKGCNRDVALGCYPFYAAFGLL